MQNQTVDVSLTAEALTQQRILVTEDKDFGELVFNRGAPTYGVVLLRFSAQARNQKWPRLAGVIAEYGEALKRGYTVITERKTRYRAFT